MRRRAVAARRGRGCGFAGGAPCRGVGPRWCRGQRGQGAGAAPARTVPVIAGVELAAAAAYRWKCQVNENAAARVRRGVAGDRPQRGRRLARGARLGRFSAVFLEDPGAHPRDILRTELTAEQARAGTEVVEVGLHGETAIERLMSHVLLGDLVSLYLAVLRGEIDRDRADRHAQGRPGRAMIVFTGGPIRTMDPARPLARSVVIDDDAIVARRGARRGRAHRARRPLRAARLHRQPRALPDLGGHAPRAAIARRP